MPEKQPSLQRRARVTDLTSDGRWATVEVVKRSGAKIIYSAPTKPLGVRFTAQGIQLLNTGPDVSDVTVAPEQGIDPPKHTQRLMKRSLHFLRREH